MRILHCCLSCFYIDGYNYQENMLPRQNKRDGHEVEIIASTETYIDNKTLGYVRSRTYFNEDGIKVIRVAYSKFLPLFLMKKIRSYSGVYSLLEEFKPDVILHHGVASREIKTIIKYKKNYPGVKIFIDSHEDYNNSATNFLSKNILHKIFYKKYMKEALPYTEKILAISREAMLFVHEMYKVPWEMIEFYPLGGDIIPTDMCNTYRREIREELAIREDEVVFIHTGKMIARKGTKELLEAYCNTNNKNSRLLLVGSLSKELEEQLKQCIKADDRIQYLGWKNPEELDKYLCAADVYVQPKSQSSTMQNSMCCHCALLLYPHESHKDYLKNNGFYVKDKEELGRKIDYMCNHYNELKVMEERSFQLAQNLLDYSELAKRLY